MENYDLIIIGGGLAGLCAAVEAGEQGAKVLLLEKGKSLGGTAFLSGRYMAFAETDLQREKGINDSVQALARDMLDVGGGVNDPKLVNAYAKYQHETYEWLLKHGVKFLSLQAVSGHSVPRGHTVDTTQLINSLFEHLQTLPNVTILYQAEAKRLLRNTTGKIDRVYFAYEGEERIVSAELGVILTSGGFTQNEKLLNQFSPNLGKAIRVGCPENTGDGLLMAWEHGAWVRDLPYLSGTYGFHPLADESPFKYQALAYYKGAIIINKHGQRFVNESISYKLIGHEALKQPDAITFQIWDQTVMDKSIQGDKLYDFNNLLEQKLIYKADSLEEIADLIQVPVETLKETIATYNAGIKNGNDEFGRKTLTHNFGQPTPIEKPPFYAFQSTVAVLATYAGIAVNPIGQVINPYGEPIPGLFAAGEVTGGFHGAGYMTGSSLGKSAIFGRVCALTALGKISNKDEVSISNEIM